MRREASLETVSTPYGVFTVDIRSDQKMYRALKGASYPNEGLLALARTFINEKSIVVDIGAHIGTFAVPLAQKAGKVIAFEPSRDAFELLSRNAAENSVSIQLVNKALGSKPGSGTLVVRKGANAGANTIGAGGDIPIVTLDSEVPQADFIKIDVEGMELEVLHGGMGLIARARPVMLFEVNLSQLRTHGTSPRDLERFFTRHGYRLYVPLERKNFELARVWSASLLTAFVAPRAWIFFGESAPFDLVAIPEERVTESASFGTALAHALRHNLSMKIRRLRDWLR